MSRKWLEKESPRWVEQGIVTQEEIRSILQLYPVKQRVIGMIPMLGSVLIGLGILSFVAANWQGIPEWLRLLLLAALMCVLYVSGESFTRKGSDKLGVAMIGAGLAAFGASIVLIGQMFHLIAYDALSMLVWSAAGILLAYLYRSRFLFLAALILLSASQFYSTITLGKFTFTGLLMLAVLAGAFVWIRKDTLVSWLFNLSIAWQAVMLLVAYDWHLPWLTPILLLPYTLGDWIKDRRLSVPMQSVAIIGMFAVSWLLILTGKGNYDASDPHWLPPALPYLALVVPLFGISLLGKLRSGRGFSACDWLLAIPLFLLPSLADFVYVVVLLVYSLFVLWQGYAEEWRFKINLGTVLFLCSTMTAYGKLTWRFMDKSLFFLIGGLLLLMLSWMLNRRRKQFLDDIEGGGKHE